MATMTSEQLRERFLDYFGKHDHEIVPSSALVPQNDPTLLFTNAGMVQFKDVFLGLAQRARLRAASSQRCMRAGGKHNDLDNVGYTARHHTFFEMLGNFSFGDYFKDKAIFYAWNFLVNHLKISPEKLWITVYEEDLEAEKIWIEQIGVDPKRVLRCGAKDNFWSMGETGPCGPCTEIYYDHGETIPGGLPGTPDENGDRYIEIWNLVFMQYERQADGTLTPLPKPSVDTGMGLERITAVMQGVHNNYDTDLFKPIIAVCQQLSVTTHLTSFQVLADHIRASSFLIMDGVIPSNEGRGYVLRRIIRRAIRHGYQLAIASPFFFKLVEPLVAIMSNAYPELKKAKSLIEKILIQEEEQFMRTLEQGMKILHQAIQNLEYNIIPGHIVFLLYDTYGFPPDLTADIAREKNLSIDEASFEREMEKQRERSREHSNFQVSHLSFSGSSTFEGYEKLEIREAKITHIYKHETDMHPSSDHPLLSTGSGSLLGEIKAGEEGYIILDKTPFYAESGGQVGDQGIIQDADNIFQVKDTKKSGRHIVHYGEIIQGSFTENDSVTASVNPVLRQRTALNHTATHLLHAALRQLLGNHIQQKGSLVTPDKLRFDFSHPAPLTPQILAQIETLMNQKIRENAPAEIAETTPEKAVESGAIALFGEKYGDTVRTLKLGSFSHEVCGGTHAKATGEIGFFKIISEAGVAAGIRRIEAVTGIGAEQWLQTEHEQYQQKIQQLTDMQKQYQKQILQLQNKLAKNNTNKLISNVKIINNIKIIAEQLDNIDSKQLRIMIDQLKSKLGSGIIALGSIHEGKTSFIIGVTPDLTAQYPANQLILKPAQILGGKGGGRPDMAQAGGDKPENIQKALEAVFFVLQKQQKA